MTLQPFLLLFLPAAMLLLWTCAVCCAYALGRIARRWKKMESVAQAQQELPPLSIILPAHNEAVNLRRHLPELLRQDYDTFEVIVIDLCSTDDTKDVLERLELQYANLRHTFTPLSARDISIERLAVSLGIRSAAYEWVVITQPNCHPVSEGWLTRIGETIVHPERSPQSPRLQTPEVLIGMACYDRQRPSWLKRKMAFFRFWNDLLHCNHLLTGHAAVRADACNFALRKEAFLRNGGFTRGQNLKAGTVELLANQCSTRENTVLMLSPNSLVVEERIPDARQWKQERVFDIETQKHQHHALLFRTRKALQQAMPLLMLAGFFLPLVAAAVFAAQDQDFVEAWITPCTQAELWLAIVAGLLLVVVYVCVYLRNFTKTAHLMGFDFTPATAFFLSLYLPFWNLAARLTHRLTAKNEFRKKFV